VPPTFARHTCTAWLLESTMFLTCSLLKRFVSAFTLPTATSSGRSICKSYSHIVPSRSCGNVALGDRVDLCSLVAHHIYPCSRRGYCTICTSRPSKQVYFCLIHLKAAVMALLHLSLEMHRVQALPNTTWSQRKPNKQFNALCFLMSSSSAVSGQELDVWGTHMST
jgi:hypothetical protein